MDEGNRLGLLLAQERDLCDLLRRFIGEDTYGFDSILETMEGMLTDAREEEYGRGHKAGYNEGYEMAEEDQEEARERRHAVRTIKGEDS